MTAPITSNRPTTTRLHHYAGRHSHGSGTPVETLFAHACGSSTPVEILFTPAWGSSTPVEILFTPARGSSTPVETFFAPARGSSTPVETFFAHAHPKWLIFAHFHHAGAIFLSQRHPNNRPVLRRGDLSFMQPLGTTPRARRCGGRRRDRRSWLRCPWAVSGARPRKVACNSIG